MKSSTNEHNTCKLEDYLNEENKLDMNVCLNL